MLTITEEAFWAPRDNVGLRGNRDRSRRDQKTSVDSSDEALIQAIARGERHAMERLYARHHVRVYRFAVRLTGNAVLAEDIVSEVFFDVWRQSGGFKAQSQVTTWLLGIVRNKSMSALRRRVESPLDGKVMDIEDSTDNPEIALDKKDRGMIIQRCLSQLSSAQREVIDLVYYHGKSVDEVAQIVGAPVSTVKTRMFYARRRLQELLAAAGVASV